MENSHRMLLLREIAKHFPYGLKCRLDLDGYLEWNTEYKDKVEKACRLRPELYKNMKSRAYTIYGIMGERVSLLELDGCDEYLVPVEFVKPYLYSMKSPNSPLARLSETSSMDMSGTGSLASFLLSMVSQNELHRVLNMMSEGFDWMYAKHIDNANLLEMDLAIEVGPDGFPYLDTSVKVDASENSVVFKDGSVHITVDGKTFKLSERQLGTVNRMLDAARQSNVGSAWIDGDGSLHVLMKSPYADDAGLDGEM